MGIVGNNRIGAYQYMQTVSVKNGISFGDKLAQTAEFASTNLISNGNYPYGEYRLRIGIVE